MIEAYWVEDYVPIVGLKDNTSDFELLLMGPEDSSIPIENRNLLDLYCLVRENQSATYYGGVVTWKADNSSLELTLTSDAAARLRIPQIYQTSVTVVGDFQLKEKLSIILNS